MKKLKVRNQKSLEEEKKEQNRKRGKRARNKGSSFERTVAHKFSEAYGVDLVRTPQSGGFAKKSNKASEYRGDISLVDDTKELKVHIECKNTVNWSLKDWIAQAESDCPKGRVPLVIFHQHNTSNNYVTLRLEDFFALVEKDKIVKEVK